MDPTGFARMRIDACLASRRAGGEPDERLRCRCRRSWNP